MKVIAGFINGWSSLVKRLLTLNTIFGSRATKLAGINDFNNFEVGNFIFAGPNQITFPGTLPAWVTAQNSGPRKFRITAGGGANNTAIFTIASFSGNTVTTVENTVLPFTGITQADGRLWAIIDDPSIARPSSTGSTMYNVHNRTPTPLGGDASEVAIVYAEHFHEKPPELEEDKDDLPPEILFHRRNEVGEKSVIVSDCSGKTLDIGPLVVVDRCGNAVRSRKRAKDPIDVCFPATPKCPGETCKVGE